jgi:hypothetical protein
MNHTASVAAEDAPIGVQLWPTITPESAPAFTLDRVEIVRTETQKYVRWVYQSGTIRVFELGQTVACDGMSLGDWMAEGLDPQPLVIVAPTQPTRATAKSHDLKVGDTFTYFGRFGQPWAEGAQVTIWEIHGGVVRLSTNDGSRYSFGVATKFWATR